MSKCEDCRGDIEHFEDCPRVAGDRIEELREKLSAAENLLLERARQAEELIREKDTANAQELKWWGLLAHAHIAMDEVRKLYPVGAGFLEVLQDVTAAFRVHPQRERELHQARLAVVEAAKSFHQVDVNQADPEGAAEFCEYLFNAVEALEKVESSP